MTKTAEDARAAALDPYLDRVLSALLGRSKPTRARRMSGLAALLLLTDTISGYYSGVPNAWHKLLTTWGLWAIIAGGMILFLLLLGIQVNDRSIGILINERNRASLSRWQLLAWTVLLSSAFLTIALKRIFTSSLDDPLTIDVPPEVWAFLALSAASSLAASFIHARKRRTTPPPPAELSAAPSEPGATHAHGALYCNASPAHASITDMFQGDERGNAAYLDVSKVQLFCFTLIAIIAYGAGIFGILQGTSAYNLAELPEVTPDLVVLLGISHALYLGDKLLNHTAGTS